MSHIRVGAASWCHTDPWLLNSARVLTNPSSAARYSKEELLVAKDQLTKMWVLRRILMQMGTIDAMEFLLDKIKDSKSNEDFFATMNQ